MEYTGARLVMTVRERKDGLWTFAVWLETPSDEVWGSDRLDQAWKSTILNFEGPEWKMAAIVQEARNHLAHVAEHAPSEDPDQLDLWGEI